MTAKTEKEELTRLIEKIEGSSATIAVIGLGYVGLPLVIRFCDEGFKVTGFDVDRKKVDLLNKGVSFIEHIPSEAIKKHVDAGSFTSTTDMALLAEADCIIICVPTPLNTNKEPDMRYVEGTADTIAGSLRSGQLISLESTTYPGTTREILLKRFEDNNLTVGEDFFLAYSPEREDPGRTDHSTKTIPKVVGGLTPSCLRVGAALYGAVVDTVVEVSSTEAAEMTKLLENIFRCVNIALVNELKMLCDRMDIDIWEVIDASSTKPFGFMPFYPGPGLGGHCIPIDPFYLSWKARQFDFSTRFIELAGEINTNMPYYIINKVAEALNTESKAIKGSKVLVLGVAYKKDVDDMRESPAVQIIELLQERGAVVDYNDPHVPTIPKMRDHELNMSSVELTEDTLKNYDCVLIATDHSKYDYEWLADVSNLIVDTRNAAPRRSNVIKA